MKGFRLRLVALILTVAVLLSGCGMERVAEYIMQMLEDDCIPYESMEYQRPDMTQIDQTLTAACEAAQGEDVDAILDAVFAFYDAYDWFYTCSSLADIRYSGDLTDIYWEEEYNYCMENSPGVEAALEELNHALAASPAREGLEEAYFGDGFFDSYDGESMWDETFLAMMEMESELQSRYYVLSEQSLQYEPGTKEYYDACADEMAQLLVELIVLRQEVADYWGYSDYAQLASDFYYYRDYTMPEAEDYLVQIRQELVPLYRKIADSDVWDAYNAYCSEAQMLDYVREAAQNMGGTVWEAFGLLETAGLYDIAYSENKYSISFETYLTSYWEPFIFVSPGLIAYDKLTLAHEFGHFCNDYACYGSYAGTDVLEVFSQGMEYLSLCYGEDTEELTRVKMADSLCTYVEQAAYATFEQRMYALEEPTVEALYALYEEVALEYGFDSVGYDRREFVDVIHFYTNPMYIISYVVSNDAAMQLYQLEQAESGAGLELYEENLTSEETYFLAFLESAGLENPFAEGRIQNVRRTLESVLE